MLIRLSFEIDELVNEMLDKLPEEIWSNKEATFCDPSAAGGQFLKEIEKRLLKYGFSKEEISKKVFGFFDDMFDLRFAKNKHNLNSSLYIANIDTIEKVILENLNNMKFDVVIGNPPYQKSSESKHKIYPHFINQSISITKECGLVSLIVPLPGIEMLLGRTASQVRLKHKFKEIIFLALNTPEKFFKNIGSTFSYFLLKNRDVDESDVEIEFLNNKNETKNINLTIRDSDFLPSIIDEISISIIKKVLNNKNEYLRSVSRIYKHFENGENRVVTKINKKGIIYKRTNEAHPDLNRHKVIFGVSGNESLIVKSEEKIMNGSSACCYVCTNSEKESKNLVKFLDSKLIKTIFYDIFNLFQNKNYYALRWVKRFPLEIEASEENIYKYFNLTQEEIDYIESTAK